MNYIEPKLLEPDYFDNWRYLCNFNYDFIPKQLNINYKFMDDPPKPLPKLDMNEKYKEAQKIIDETVHEIIKHRIINSISPIIVSNPKWCKEELVLKVFEIMLVQARWNKKDKRKIKSLNNKVKKLKRKKRY